jgi:hypothetical protein
MSVAFAWKSATESNEKLVNHIATLVLSCMNFNCYFFFWSFWPSHYILVDSAKKLVFAKGLLFTRSLSIHSSHNIGQASWMCFDCWKCQIWQFCWLTTEFPGKFKCQNNGQCFGVPPSVFLFCTPNCPCCKKCNASQLKPNHHVFFLKLLFRSCKVEIYFLHKLLAFNKAIYVIISSNIESHKQFSLFDT